MQSLAERGVPTTGDFGAHSLRAGFVTKALTDDRMSIPEVQSITHPSDPAVLLRYRRRTRSGRREDARRRSPMPARTPPAAPGLRAIMNAQRG